MRVFKEIVLSTLILIVILVTMGIVLYDKLPALKKIPKAQEYSKSLEADKVLEEVVNQEETKTAIRTYRMTKAEINALSGSRRFEKGKSNPFADYTTRDTTSTSGTRTPSTGGTTNTSGKIFDNSNDGVSK